MIDKHLVDLVKTYYPDKEIDLSDYCFKKHVANSMKKAILLIRVSTLHQDLQQQTEAVKKAALDDGYSPDNLIIIENKESAIKLSEEERVGLNSMKNAIEKDPDIEAVYVYEVSRIARKAGILYSIRDYLQMKKVQLISITPPMKMFDENWGISMTAAMLFSIFSALSEQETYIRVSRMMRGKEKKKSEGKLTSGKPLYGYSITDDKTVIINEKEAAIVREIYDRYERGETCGSIAKDMYLSNIFNINRLTSVRCYISNILRDERYTGILPYKEIINPIQYDKVKTIRTGSREKFSRLHYTDKEYICAGLIYTDNGYAMTPSFKNNRYSKSNDVEVGNLSVNMKVVDAISLYALKEHLKNNNIPNTESDELSKKLDRLKNTEKGIIKKTEELDAEIERINTRIIKGRISESEGDKMIDERDKERADLEEKLIDIQYNISSLTNHLIYINSFLYENTLPPLETYSQQKDEMRRHIKRITVSKIAWGKYSLKYEYNYSDKVNIYSFYSMNRGYKVWNESGEEIKV